MSRENSNSKDTCTAMLIALFTTAKTWKQPKCPATEEWIKMWHIYTMEYYSAIKRKKQCYLHHMDGPRDDQTKWSQSDRERQISYDITYTWNLTLKSDTNELIYKTEIDSQT